MEEVLADEEKLTPKESKRLSQMIFFRDISEWKKLPQSEKDRISRLDFHAELDRIFGEVYAEKHRGDLNDEKE